MQWHVRMLSQWFIRACCSFYRIMNVEHVTWCFSCVVRQVIHLPFPLISVLSFCCITHMFLRQPGAISVNDKAGVSPPASQ